MGGVGKIPKTRLRHTVELTKLSFPQNGDFPTNQMARPRKPSQILMFTGAFKKNPGRAVPRSNEPIADGDPGPAPDHLTDREAAVWDEMLAKTAPGHITASDGLALEILCKLTVRVRDGDTHPRVLSELRHVLVQLGLTPSSRSHVQVDRKPGVSPGATASFGSI